MAAACLHQATYATVGQGLINLPEMEAGSYTLIETAKLNGIDPQARLTDVLRRIADHKITRIDDLLGLPSPAASM